MRHEAYLIGRRRGGIMTGSFGRCVVTRMTCGVAAIIRLYDNLLWCRFQGLLDEPSFYK